MVTEALPTADGATVLEACTVTAAGDGVALGAVKNPLALIVPTALLPPGIPFTIHVTVVTVAFCTVAANCMPWPTWTLALTGDTETLTGCGGLVMFTEALPTADGATVLEACTRTFAGEGIALGAV